MPFGQLVNPQQIEVSVAGPGDARRLILCSGLAQGNFLVSSPSGGGQSQAEAWQFKVGPQIESTEFRRVTATAAFAGLQMQAGQGQAQVAWSIDSVLADYDDDEATARVIVTNHIVTTCPPGQSEMAGVSMLAYNVSILAAEPSA